MPPVAYLPISAQGGPSEQTAAFLKRRSSEFEGGSGVSGFGGTRTRLGPERSWSAVCTITAVVHIARTATATST